MDTSTTTLSNNRKLLIVVGLVLLFVVIVLVWYFFYAKPIIAPSLDTTKNPIPTRTVPVRAAFLNWVSSQVSSSTTEVTDPSLYPLTRIWDKPATGQTFITTDILQEIAATTTVGTTTIATKKMVRATSTTLLFVDKITGYIYGYPLETGKVFQISNTVIPGVHDAYFFNNGTRVMMRYIDREKNTVVGLIASVPAVVPTSNALPLISVQYLNAEVSSIALNENKDRASYVVATEKGSAVYTVTNKDPVYVTSSPFREWSLSYGGNELFVTTKPSAYVEGSTLSLTTFQPEIQEKTGLMSNPTIGGVMLNSMWGNKGLLTFLSTNGSIKLLQVATLAPKCSWGKKYYLVCAIPRVMPTTTEGLPDDWFQGRVSFVDDLMVVDIKTGSHYLLYEFTQSDGEFDITNIALSEAHEYLSFTKQQDGTLWLLSTRLLEGE